MNKINFNIIAGLVFFWCLSALSVNAQKILLSGSVNDAEHNAPLEFATIGIRNTTVGTASNADGKFVLEIPERYKDSVLVCSFMGYKDFSMVVGAQSREFAILLHQETFTLDEVEVRPWSAWDYVWNAMQKISDNYIDTPYMTQGYYNESISENHHFIKFTEGVIETYNPAYGDTATSQSKVLKARRGANLHELQFMHDKLEKKYQKERDKAGEANEDKETLSEQIVATSLGGPESILSADPLRDTADFLNIKNLKKFKYHIDGYNRYHGEQVVVIEFESKGVYDHQRQKGKIYISLKSDAIMSISLQSKIVIPGIARPVIFLMGYGIKNPVIEGDVHYKPVGDKWYLSDISMQAATKITKKKMFRKNEKSDFAAQMSVINTHFNLDQVHPIPEKEWIDPEKPLEEQVPPDPEFWKTYPVARPAEMAF